MEIKHDSHPHSLLYQEIKPSEAEGICGGCKEFAEGPSYTCPKCHYFLHRKCAELPSHVTHPAHHDHPLSLHTNPLNMQRLICHLCRSGFHPDDWLYSCFACGFDLDFKCAFPPCRLIGSDQHKFRRLSKPIAFVCDACGKSEKVGPSIPFICATCQLLVHKECIPLTGDDIKMYYHDHRISFAYCRPPRTNGSNKNSCGICRLQLSHLGAYYDCSACGYVAHVDCARHFIEDEEQDRQRLNPCDSKVKPIQPQTGEENENFGHEHLLKAIQIDEEGEVNWGSQRCEACMLPLPVSPESNLALTRENLLDEQRHTTLEPICGCKGCHFYLHKHCTELPRKKLEHPLHQQHPLTLLPKAPTPDGLFKCEACDQYSHGFVYTCDKCDFYLDIRCSRLPETFDHQEGHSAELITSGEDTHRLCCIACRRASLTYFCCDYCDFIVDFRCLSLSDSVVHKFDKKHPLVLTYASKNYFKDVPIDAEDYCDVCEREIEVSPSLFQYQRWFYRCEDYDISIHPECVRGKYSFIKLGGCYSYVDIHEHPLTLVQKLKEYPPCDNCAQPFFAGENMGDPCQDLALQCSQCEFVIHRKGPCFDRYPYNKGKGHIGL